jgi:hypothetical protein
MCLLVYLPKKVFLFIIILELIFKQVRCVFLLAIYSFLVIGGDNKTYKSVQLVSLFVCVIFCINIKLYCININGIIFIVSTFVIVRSPGSISRLRSILSILSPSSLPLGLLSRNLFRNTVMK